MKKVTVWILLVALMLSLAACASDAPSNTNEPTNNDNAVNQDNQTPPAEENNEPQPEDNNREPDTETGDTSGTIDTENAELTEIMAILLTDVGELPMLGEMPLDAENFSMFAFVEAQEGVEGLVSEAMINAVAHSVVLLRVTGDADAAAIAEEMEANADPRKWICVEAEKVAVVQKGNLILLAMSAEATVDAIVDNFNALF